MVCWTIPTSSVTRWRFMQLGLMPKLLAVQKQFGSFNDYIWSLSISKTINNQITNYKEALTKNRAIRKHVQGAEKARLQICRSRLCLFIPRSSWTYQWSWKWLWLEVERWKQRKFQLTFISLYIILFLGRGLQLIGQNGWIIQHISFCLFWGFLAYREELQKQLSLILP